jgi:hypothetical protein
VIYKGAPAMAKKIVKITIVPDRISVDKEPVQLLKQKEEKVRWVSDMDFRIDFPLDKCPFQTCSYLSANGIADSEKPEKDASGYYKYTVTDIADPSNTLDPGVIIRP